MVVVIVLLILASFSSSDEKEQTKTYDWTKLLKYSIDPNPQETKIIARSRYKESPPLRPERFRRLIKMRWGVDIDDYPENALIWFGPEYKLSVDNQIIIGHYNFPEDGPIWYPTPTENVYSVFGKYFLFSDEKAYPELIKYICEIAEEYDRDYAFFDMLLAIYNTSLSVPSQLMGYIDSMAIQTRNHTNSYVLSVFLINEDDKESRLSHRVSEIKRDMLYLYIKDQESKGRVLRNRANQVDNMINIGFDIDASIYPIPVFYNTINPWSIDIYIKSRAAYLSFLLQLGHKYQRGYVIRYMSGQTGNSPNKETADLLRSQIRENNYYGHAVLREFCEDPERAMPTMEKVGTSFYASVANSNTLLYLEPYADSYDIDIMQPMEGFKAYEMGYDDYYFVEVIKPVESPIAGPDGYAMILDRTETVYGYIKKADIKEIAEVEYLKKTINTPADKQKRGVITDPDGYVNIRTTMSVEGEIAGRIKDREIFHYWEIADSSWWYVQTADNVTGFVHKSRIREKPDAGGWESEY